MTFAPTPLSVQNFSLTNTFTSVISYNIAKKPSCYVPNDYPVDATFLQICCGDAQQNYLLYNKLYSKWVRARKSMWTICKICKHSHDLSCLYWRHPLNVQSDCGKTKWNTRLLMSLNITWCRVLTNLESN